MTAQEKAQDLVRKYDEKRISNYKSIFPNWSKECALIAVNEILETSEVVNYEYWNEVKAEIELL